MIELYLQLPIIHYGLILILILLFGACLFVFPTLCRYELTYKQYLRQAIGLFFTNLTESIAMLIGSFLVMGIYVAFPIFKMFVYIFTYTYLLKACDFL